MTKTHHYYIVSLVLILLTGLLFSRPVDPTPVSSTNTAATSELPPLTEKPIIQKKIEMSADPNKLEGFLVKLTTSTSGVVLEIDQIQTFGDEEQELLIGTATSVDGPRYSPGAADLAAIEDGSCALTPEDPNADGCAPNRFYLRNNSTSTQSFEVDPKVVISIYQPNWNDPSDHPFKPLSLETLVERYTDLTKNNFLLQEKSRAVIDYPYLFETKNERIIRMEQQLTP